MVSPRTTAAQAGRHVDPAHGAVAPPIHPSTTFARDADYEPVSGHIYSRYSSPTVDHIEAVMADLDGGDAALAFSAGLGATTTVLETVPPGSHIVAPRVMYHGGQDWMVRMSERRDITITLFDQTRPEALAEALRPGETDLVWIESPVNPTWDVIDIDAAAEVAHAAGAVLVADCTVAPPVTTRSLDLGADIAFHSATKYLNGHSDLTGGILVTRDPGERWEQIRRVRTLTGTIMPAFSAWLLLRGLRTLFLRFEAASANALAIARHFEGHDALEAVLYPGLESHPGHEVARRQMTGGFGGMMSLLTRTEEEAAAVARSTRVFVPATSLGGVESLIEHRKAVEGPHSIVPGNLLRLSIGIEAAEDLIVDLEQALASA